MPAPPPPAPTTPAAPTTDELFFGRTDLDPGRVQALVDDTVGGGDDGELFLEHRQSESLGYDDGRLRMAGFDTGEGFGLRCVAAEASGYAHAGELTPEALTRAAASASAAKRGHAGQAAQPPQATNIRLYGPENPLDSPGFPGKVALLEAMDAYARARDSRVRQVSINLAASWQAVHIVRPGGEVRRDVRPLVRMDVSIVAGEAERRESGHAGAGGRAGYAYWTEPARWKALVDEAVRQALTNLRSLPAPAGEMDVVLGPGLPGILLHEAIGHGLEGDFNRKRTSAFAGLMGRRIASPGVTVVDDGTLEGRRGSLTIDDEGTPTTRTVLIEDGILTGYMQDRQNARLMGMAPTGNGRRQSYAHAPMPRMTNTFMLPGEDSPEDITARVKRGLYARTFGGGQVDITSGKFVFSCTEAYIIEDGKLGAPVKGAMVIGNGPDALTRIAMVGNDMALDTGVGTCGKLGQGVPVGVGQPTLLIRGLTVGGTSA